MHLLFIPYLHYSVCASTFVRVYICVDGMCEAISMMLLQLFGCLYIGRRFIVYNKLKLKQHTGQWLFDIGNAYE